MPGLDHKIVLVTGGSGGLSYAMAEAFARQGCRVAIAAPHEGAIQAAGERLARIGAQVLALSGDISRREEGAEPQ